MTGARSALLLLAGAWLLVGCTGLPTDVERIPSSAYTDTQTTSLGARVAAEASQHPGMSGFAILEEGRAFFTDVAALAEAAERSIDAQYYIWQADTVGRLLIHRLLMAADRGVRVRLLLDDFPASGKRKELAALDRHPNVHVRIYNPIITGVPVGLRKVLRGVLEFGRVNRRMHNKTFIADGTAAVVGGRNIGNEYADHGGDSNFFDRDLLAVGPIVSEISTSFDDYWNSEWAIPAESVAYRLPSEEEAAKARADLEAFVNSPEASLRYVIPTGPTLQPHFDAMPQRLTWARSELLYDVPHSDALGDGEIGEVAAHLLEFSTAAREEILIESAYFIPAKAALDMTDDVHADGVQIRALTNSLASTDVPASYAGYKRRRPYVLDAGVDLYEFREDAAVCRERLPEPEMCEPPAYYSLHAKSVVIDREILFVGSYNLSERSVYLNSETVIVVYSPELASAVADTMLEHMSPQNSWQVTRDDEGRTQWSATIAGTKKQISQEPPASTGRRFQSFFFSLFPLERYL